MGTRVFVGNVNPQTSRKELERLFSRIGEVLSIYMPLDRDTRQPRGFAFVDLADRAAAEQAIERLDGAMLGGRRLRLSWAVARSQPTPPNRFTPPSSPGPSPMEDWDWMVDGQEGPEDRGAGHPRRRRRGGKHGSDRRHGLGTRRFIE